MYFIWSSAKETVICSLLKEKVACGGLTERFITVFHNCKWLYMIFFVLYANIRINHHPCWCDSVVLHKLVYKKKDFLYPAHKKYSIHQHLSMAEYSCTKNKTMPHKKYCKYWLIKKIAYWTQEKQNILTPKKDCKYPWIITYWYMLITASSVKLVSNYIYCYIGKVANNVQ